MKKVKMIWGYGGMILIGSLIMSLTLATTVLSASAKDEAEPFKIGVVTSMSGAGYGLGQRALLGVRYRIEEEINKSGGINGHPVKLFIHDTGTRADQAAMLVERAATVDKVFAILGPNSSTDVYAAFPTAVRLGVPDISMGGMIRGICEKHAPWSFATMGSDDLPMEMLASLIDRFKVKNAVIMVDAKYNFAVSQGERGYKIAERKGVKVLNDKGKLDIETGWADFTPQVTQIKSLRPDLICALMLPVDMAHLAVAAKGAAIDPKVVPFFGGVDILPEFVVAAREAGESWYGSAEFNIQSTDSVQQAWQKKVTDYGKTITSDPGIYTVHSNTSCGYDAAAFLCEAIRQAKITPNTPLQEARAKIRDELPKIKMKTYSSVEFRFGEGGRYEKNRLVKPMFLTQVTEGKIVTVGRLED